MFGFAIRSLTIKRHTIEGIIVIYGHFYSSVTQFVEIQSQSLSILLDVYNALYPGKLNFFESILLKGDYWTSLEVAMLSLFGIQAEPG